MLHFFTFLEKYPQMQKIDNVLQLYKKKKYQELIWPTWEKDSAHVIYSKLKGFI